MKFFKHFSALLLAALMSISLFSCDIRFIEPAPEIYIDITNADRVQLKVGETYALAHNVEDEYSDCVSFSSSASAVTVSRDGLVEAVSVGKSAVTATYKSGSFESRDTVLVEVTDSSSGGGTTINPDISGDAPDVSGVDPYKNMSATEFYANYTPATSYTDSYYRSLHGFMSGSITVPDQMPTVSPYQPRVGGLLVRNTTARYEDGGNTYVITDAKGNEVTRIYKCGAYITLEEVAAYMYAFGGSSDSLPANYISKKSGKPSTSIWGKYLRVNHSYFSGDTSNYPYEPELPNIKGCGGSLQYYEMDIGTTGTRTPTANSSEYNNGNRIVRGAARLVYGRRDINGNGVFDEGELYVFYTYNHYNDFMEYLNYFGGWGEPFGNVTGGGVFDSETNCNPTPYVPVHWGALTASSRVAEVAFILDRRTLYGFKALAFVA